MDKIWDRNPLKSEVIGRCGWDEKTENAKKIFFKKISFGGWNKHSHIKKHLNVNTVVTISDI